MKKSILLSFLVITLFSACTSCNNNDKKVVVPVVVPLDSIPGIVEKHGNIGDGTTMNMLQLIGDDGDTLMIETPNQTVMGGIVVGDEVQVVYNVTKNGLVAQTAINVTALQHLWTQKAADGHSQSIEFDEGGVLVTYDMNVDYSNWQLKDGMLLLSGQQKVVNERPIEPDTFQIMSLSSESLVLMHGDMTSEFELEN